MRRLRVLSPRRGAVRTGCSALLTAGMLTLACIPRPPATTPPAPPPAPTPQPPPVQEADESPPSVVPSPDVPSPRTLPAEPPRPLIPPLVRVGLATDLDELALPCCGTHLEMVVGDARGRLDQPTLVRPAAALEGIARYRLQVAALRDEVQADGLAARLQSRLGVAGDATFDAELGLYRVRVGSYATRDEAQALERRMRALGAADVWVVQEGGRVEAPAFVVSRNAQSWRLSGRWLAVESEEGWVRIRDRAYRGRILLYLNDRGKLNLINELAVDDYLRGVVPREMGPEIYDEIEVLKAQTVAARTYTLRNLGEFRSEGYDICATPRCQVYGGLGVEHRLSNRAIEETRGEVLVYEDELADTLYSSTCGGHTEDVEVVFPLRHEPYLRGVPCAEAGEETLGSRAAAGASLAGTLMRRLLPPSSGTSEVAVLAGRLEHLALLVGIEPAVARLRSLETTAVQRYVTSLFDLSLDARLLLPPPRLRALLASPPDAWSPVEHTLAVHLSAEEGELGGEAAEELLLGLSLALGVLEVSEAAYVGHAHDLLEVRRAGRNVRLPLSATLVTYTSRAGRPVAGDLALAPGDRVRLYSRHGSVLAMEQTSRTARLEVENLPRRSWSRVRTLGEVRRAVQDRYPGFDLRSFEVLRRGVSGRVARLRLLDGRGEQLLLEGLQVRWTLGLPDTLFTVRPLDQEGDQGWLFEGRGWGHGVGLCQVGAFGMARRGQTYDEILDYYYSGVRLVRAQDRPGVVVSAGGAR